VNIGFDARLAFYNRAGIGIYIRQLMEGLPQAAPGDRFIIFRMWKDRETLAAELAPNVLHRAAFTPCHHPLERWIFGAEVAAAGLVTRLDLLHSPDHIPPQWTGGASVITVHDLAFLRYPETHAPDSRRYYGQICWAVRRADAILADSLATKHDLINFLRVPPERIRVVYPAPRPGLARPPERTVRGLREALGLTRPYILFVGTLELRKNLVRLIEAFGRVRRVFDGELVLAGEPGFGAEAIYAAAAAALVRGRVRLVGRIKDEDLPALYAGAEVFVMPSLYEGFGLPPLEAMACGTPVVASNVSSLPEVCGDAALLCTPTDVESIAVTIERVLLNTAVRRRLIERGLARARSFTWERTVRDVLACYREVAG
jgi:glycosyltransferase involved in cell wall biosynthesis